MADQDDLLSSLVGATPNTAAGVAAMVRALRQNQATGDAFTASGLSGLQPIGESMLRGVQSSTEQAGRQSVEGINQANTQQRHADQMTRYDDQANIADATNRETIRWHNMQNDIATGKLNKTTNMPDADKSQVQAILKGDAPYPTSRQSPRMANIADAVMEANPNFDTSMYDMKKKAQIAFGTGVQGTQIKQSGATLGHLSDLLDTSKVLSNTQFPMLNSILNAGKSFTGHGGEIGAFNVNKRVLSDELNKFLVGTGGSALADREGLLKELNDANSPDAISTVGSKIKDLMAEQLGGLKNQFESSGLGDFSKKLIDPRSRDLLGMAPLPTTGPLANSAQAFRTVAPNYTGFASKDPQGQGGSVLPQSTGYNPQGLLAALKGQDGPTAAPATSVAPGPQAPQGGPSGGQQAPIPVRSLPQEMQGVTIVKKGMKNGKRVALLSTGEVVPLD